MSDAHHTSNPKLLESALVLLREELPIYSRFHDHPATVMAMRFAADEIERLRAALGCLLPGLELDLRYADPDDDRDALRSRIKCVRDALAGVDYEAAPPAETKAAP